MPEPSWKVDDKSVNLVDQIVGYIDAPTATTWLLIHKPKAPFTVVQMRAQTVGSSTPTCDLDLKKNTVAFGSTVSAGAATKDTAVSMSNTVIDDTDTLELAVSNIGGTVDRVWFQIDIRRASA